MPATLQYSGTLISAAHACTRLLDGDAHCVPVVAMDIELDNALRNVMHVEQPFPAGQHDQAKAAAHRLKKGVHITVDVPVLDIHLVARNATHIHVITDQPQEPTQSCLL